MHNPAHFEDHLYHAYENYCTNSLANRRIRYDDILPLINLIKDNHIFNIYKVGKSISGRDISLITIGKGSKKIFLWSQMHGDESTATRALFDLTRFFSSHDEFDIYRSKIFNSVSLFILPMLNPDGAEIFQRRNAIEIDLNRDARSLQAPESKILQNIFDTIKPDYAFNLHDQHNRYSAGKTHKPAAISFLAPLVDKLNSYPNNRIHAMRLIGYLYCILSRYIPGHIAKYSEEYEPRAFGELFQSSGASTILIESGGWKNDPDKNFIRKLNFIALLSAIYSISENSYRKIKKKVYQQIPDNEELLFDLLLKNLSLKHEDNVYITDIGINREEVSQLKENSFFIKSTIEDLGDLSTFYGIEEYDFSGYEILPGKVLEGEEYKVEELNNKKLNELYRAGCTCIKLSGKNLDTEFFPLPINVTTNEKSQITFQKISVGENASFIITKHKSVKYVVINGFLKNIMNDTGSLKNGILMK